jgi:Mg2+ and Co2+ transporter CorA
LKKIEESLHNLPLMIMSLASTIKRIQGEYDQGLTDATSSMEYVQLTKLFDHQLEETQLLSKRIQILQERVHDLIIFTQDKLNRANSTYMMQVAQSAKADSAAMKNITIITVLFLPATFVAVCSLSKIQTEIR